MNESIISVMQHSMENTQNNKNLICALKKVLLKNKDPFTWIEIGLVNNSVNLDFFKYSRKRKHYFNFKKQTTRDRNLLKRLDCILNLNLVDRCLLEDPEIKAEFKNFGFENFKILPPLLVVKKIKGRLIFKLQTNIVFC